MTSTYRVAGMTCTHCEASVSEEVLAIPGVTEVSVDFTTGELNVVGDVDAEKVRAAVAEAGYELQQ